MQRRGCFYARIQIGSTILAFGKIPWLQVLVIVEVVRRDYSAWSAVS
jgi:hypothetical protein